MNYIIQVRSKKNDHFTSAMDCIGSSEDAIDQGKVFLKRVPDIDRVRIVESESLKVEWDSSENNFALKETAPVKLLNNEIVDAGDNHVLIPDITMQHLLTENTAILLRIPIVGKGFLSLAFGYNSKGMLIMSEQTADENWKQRESAKNIGLGLVDIPCDCEVTFVKGKS